MAVRVEAAAPRGTTDVPRPDALGDDRDAIGIDGNPRPRHGGRWFAAIAAVALAGGVGYLTFQGQDPATEKAPVTEATAPTTPKPQIEEMKPSPEEIAASEKEERDEAMEEAVKDEICTDYGKRYVKARTGVELVRSVQLSQAAGCDWGAMLRADAATHDFIPEAVEAVGRLDVHEVTTGGSTMEEDADTMDDLKTRIQDIDRKVDELRYRVR